MVPLAQPPNFKRLQIIRVVGLNPRAPADFARLADYVSASNRIVQPLASLTLPTKAMLVPLCVAASVLTSLLGVAGEGSIPTHVDGFTVRHLQQLQQRE